VDRESARFAVRVEDEDFCEEHMNGIGVMKSCGERGTNKGKNDEL
jgi:hypothetical protein